MSILKVARMGHPVLRRVADPVPPDAISTAPVQGLIDDLLETVDEYDGAGLAAPQVHASVRIVVLALDESGMQVWINPVLTPLTDELHSAVEGCLSVPELRGRVSRPAAIEVRALDRSGAPIHLELRGFPAVVAQHECDHLDGVLYVDKAEPRSLMFLEEFRRYGLAQPGDYDLEGDHADDGYDDRSTDPGDVPSDDRPDELADDLSGELADHSERASVANRRPASPPPPRASPETRATASAPQEP